MPTVEWDDDFELCCVFDDSLPTESYQLQAVGHGWLVLHRRILGIYSSLDDITSRLGGAPMLPCVDGFRVTVDRLTHIEVTECDSAWICEQWSVVALGANIDVAHAAAVDALRAVMGDVTGE